MLRDVHFLSILVLVELLVNFDDFLEVQLLEVNIHPSNKEVDQVALLQLIIPQTPQSFQHLRQLPVEIVKAIDPLQTLMVLMDELHVVGDGQHLDLEHLIGQRYV